MVIRGPGGVGRQLGAEHSQRLESYFQSIPGVQLVACSTVANAKALLKSAIRSDNPIIFFEHVLLYNVKGARPPQIFFYVARATLLPFLAASCLVHPAFDRPSGNCEGAHIQATCWPSWALPPQTNLKRTRQGR